MKKEEEKKKKKPNKKMPNNKALQKAAFYLSSHHMIRIKLLLTHAGDDSSVAVTNFVNADTLMNSKNKNTHQSCLFILSQYDKV